MSGAAKSVILVVDDDPGLRHVLRNYLSETYTVLDVDRGEAALELLARELVDLVILDIVLPGLSGIETCRAIKTRTHEPYLPVLLVTGVQGQQERYAGLEAGADDFLLKPFSVPELKLRVRAFLLIREQYRVIRQQIESLQQLQDLKDDLVSLVVHDLRNPLTALKATLELLEIEMGAAVPRRIRNDVQQAREWTKEIQARIDEILQVRLLEEGQLSARREPTPLTELIVKAIATVHSQATARGIRIQPSVEGPPIFALDQSLVRRCIENLLANAIRYSPRHETIVLSVWRDRSNLVVEVADRGPGVPDAQKTTLFEKFGSVEARRGGDRRGSGLGLYFVKLVMKAHEGYVLVEDQAGGGIRFRLVFPPATFQ